MPTKTALLEKSVEVLIEKAEDCIDLAKTQHAIADKQHDAADKQHEAADKLDTLATELISDAVSVKGEMEVDSMRASPAMRTQPEPKVSR